MVFLLLDRAKFAHSVTFKVEFPIKPHLKQYLRFKLGNIDPVNLDLDNIFATLIWSQLDKPEYNNSAQVYPLYKDQLCVVLNKRLSNRRRFAMTFSGCQSINAGLDELFNQHFYLYVDTKTEAGFEKEKSIFDFMNKVGLGEEHIPYETLKKRHDRYRNALAKGKAHKSHQKGEPLS